VHAIADLLPRKSLAAQAGREVLRARWVNSYSRGTYEDSFPDILHEVVLEAAQASHRDFQRTREEVERVATALPSVASP
jgi:ribosomal protein S7